MRLSVLSTLIWTETILEGTTEKTGLEKDSCSRRWAPCNQKNRIESELTDNNSNKQITTGGEWGAI